MTSSEPAETFEDLVERLRAAGSVFAEEEARLIVTTALPAQRESLVRRRIQGQPLEHLLGWVEFCGLRLGVDPGVFVPRRRTELLVRRSLDVLQARSTRRQGRTVVIELCCGAGAVSAAILDRVPDIDLLAVDLDDAAVMCARRNLAELGAQVIRGDLYASLPRRLLGQVALVVANAPYVPTEAIALMPAEARLYEPIEALDGGRDGLDVARRVVAGAADWLTPDGTLIIETSTAQADVLAMIFTRECLDPTMVRDVALDATIVVGSRASVQTDSLAIQTAE